MTSRRRPTSRSSRRRSRAFRRDLVVLLVLTAFAGFMAFGVGGTPTAAQPPGPPQASPRQQPPPAPPTERIDVELGVDFPYDI